jgi:16S rRNA (cytosine967-C5)-methyltransferase
MSATPARRVAYEVLRRTFEEDAWADRAFRSTAERNELEGRALAQAQRLAYGAVQRRGTTDHLAESLSNRPPAELDAPLVAALRLGLYELLFASATPDHAAVDQAVQLAKDGMGAGGAARARGAAGLVNAILRRAARERDALLGGLSDSTPEDAAICHSYPEWLARMWWEELGAGDARSLMRAMNEPAETALRVNTLNAADPEAVATELTKAGVAASLVPPEAIVVDGPTGPPVAELMEAGQLIPQARSSQLAARLLGPQPGERVLDLCAGPGVKTTHLAALMENDGEIVSVERDPGRARQIAELSERAEVRIGRVIEGDATVTDLGDGYDRALVDPPCTDLGALASRPDARWRKSAEQPAGLAALQRGILERATEALRPGGVAVYSTCTISRREGEEVVSGIEGVTFDDLGADHPQLASPHDSRFLQTRPDRDGTDGFFFARMSRREA